jgi:hypothetical protein
MRCECDNRGVCAHCVAMAKRDDHEKRIAALEKILPVAALDLIYVDQHSWSTRPCSTCNAITTMIGQPYGCDRYRRDKIQQPGTK